MSQLLFTPPAPITVTIAGTAQRFPVHRVYCVGRNYAAHAREMGANPDREQPFFFLKPADAVVEIAAGQTTEWTYPAATQDCHHEMELVVALQRGGTDIPAERAASHIFGYAPGLDMTRRDLQTQAKKNGHPWEAGKAFEKSAPIGPITPMAVTGELLRGAITLSVNGKAKQRGDLADLIWSVNETISVLSRFWALRPGDLIYTGTPEGVGAVHRGDLLEGHIDGLGDLKLRVV